MNQYPKREEVERVKSYYPNGARVELIETNVPYLDLPTGLTGAVIGVDDMATVHVAWDNGVRLGMAYRADRIRKIDD